MLESKFLKFNFKTSVLIKNNYLNREDIFKKIFEHVKVINHDSFFFLATLYPREIPLILNDRILMHPESSYKENVFYKRGFVYYLKNCSKNDNCSENYIISFDSSNFLYSANMKSKKKQLRKIINEEIGQALNMNPQKFIRFFLKEDILLCDDVTSKYELFKFYNSLNPLQSNLNLLTQLNQYCNSYQSFFIEPKKQMNNYLDICDILVHNKTKNMGKSQLSKYLIAEILTQKSKNLEKMSAELTSFINIFENQKGDLENLMKKDNRKFRVWISKILSRNTYDPSIVLLIDKLLYSRKNLDDIINTLKYLSQHINKFYL